MAKLDSTELFTLSPPQAAKMIGVSVAQVREWMRRRDDPLPSIATGVSGSFRRVIARCLDEWLAREAERTHPGR